jgi:hypothetical protein
MYIRVLRCCIGVQGHKPVACDDRPLETAGVGTIVLDNAIFAGNDDMDEEDTGKPGEGL